MIDPNFDSTAIPLGYTYDGGGRVLSYRDESGFWYVYTRDDAGRVLAYRDNSGFWYVYFRDVNGRVLMCINSDGYRECYTYDDGNCNCTITHTQEAA